MMTARTAPAAGQDLISHIKAGDFAKARSAIEELRRDGGTSSAQQALVELLNSGAVDRLIADRAELTAQWMATQIVAACENRDKPTASRMAFELRELLKQSGTMLDEELARRVLKGLKSVRAFEAMARLGDRLIALGLKDPMIPKLVAQGLIETGYTQSAVAVLERMLMAMPDDHPERLDGLGLAGRAYKQVYMDAASQAESYKTPSLRDSLLRAATCYENGYIATRGRLSPSFGEWSYHAINLVAVCNRAKRDGISTPLRINDQALPGQILSEFNALPIDQIKEFDLATAAEACVAIGDWTRAEQLLIAYAQRPDVSSFSIASTLRQLTEVWRLNPAHDVQGRILYFLSAQLLAKDGGHVTLTPQDRVELMSASQSVEQKAQLEVMLSDEHPKPISWFKTGLQRTNSVALVQRKSDRQGIGTGFLVRGGDFIPHLGDEPMLLTNAHVLSTRSTELGDPHVPALNPKDGYVEFIEASSSVQRRSFEIDRVVWDSPRSELDACLVALKSPPTDIDTCGLASREPTVNKSRVIVVGHPSGGREMKLSLYDSPVTFFGAKGLLSDGADARRQFMRYTNPTVPGNSGSPVFDIDDWNVVGLHHAGSKAQATGAAAGGASAQPFGNEGVFIRSICEAAARGERSFVAVAPLPEAVVSGTPHSTTGPNFESAAIVAPRSNRASLAHDIPAQMIERQAITVTANISRLKSERLFAGLRRGSAVTYDIVPTAAMTVSLRSPEEAFAISPLTSETQWLDRTDAALDSITTWKWSVKPLRTGAHQMTLVLHGREARGGIEAALPAEEQVIPVQVRVDGSARAMTFSKWLAVATAGGMVSWIGQWAMRQFL